ncbi:hypothetical protein [Caulobacter sp. BK020]|uniref:hypothetical protein n=1 Tax=Caulobacter sp. BK020 TaxID=2512117 RepID=UPI001404F659|nr:hypothetical protein [Caulobacter sp. BK020]
MKTFDAIRRHQGAIFNQTEGMGGGNSRSRRKSRQLYVLSDKLGHPAIRTGEMPSFKATMAIDAQISGTPSLSFPIPYRATVMWEARPIA